MWMWILIGLSISTKVHGYSDGRFPEVCASMSPGHGSRPQTAEPPFEVVYQHGNEGEPITVTLRSKTSATFRGFMLEAREKGMVDAGRPVGKFILLDSAVTQLLTCSGLAGSAVSQRNNLRKSSIRVNWTAEGAELDIAFRATFVQTFSVFWEQVDVNVTLPLSTTPPPSTQPSTASSTAEPSTTEISTTNATGTSPAESSTTKSTTESSTTKSTAEPNTAEPNTCNSMYLQCQLLEAVQSQVLQQQQLARVIQNMSQSQEQQSQVLQKIVQSQEEQRQLLQQLLTKPNSSSGSPVFSFSLCVPCLTLHLFVWLCVVSWEGCGLLVS